MTQDVDPETFYLVGKRLNELAGQMYDAFAVNVTILGETAAMAGSDDAGTAWATSYDARAREVLDAVNDLTLAMENYGGVVIQAGYNHELAEHNATPGAGAPPAHPPELASTAGVLTAPPSAGGPGQGLIDNALGLVDQIGVPVPDGDTDKVDKAAQAWDRLATVYQTETVPEALDVQAGIFSNTSTPEVEQIGRDLGELRDAPPRSSTPVANCHSPAGITRPHSTSCATSSRTSWKCWPSNSRPPPPSASRPPSSPSASAQSQPPPKPRTPSPSSPR